MNAIATPTRHYAPDDLLKMPDGDRYELVDGQLVERNIGTESSHIGGRIFRWLGNYGEDGGLGIALPADASYRCFPDDSDKVRRPDASFIRQDRVPPTGRLKGHCLVAPDLVVEVVSPNDLYSDVEEKVAEYLAAGVQLVWVVNPPTRSVRIRRADGTSTDLGDADELTGETILPGFRCRIGDLFLPPGSSHAT